MTPRGRQVLGSMLAGVVQSVIVLVVVRPRGDAVSIACFVAVMLLSLNFLRAAAHMMLTALGRGVRVAASTKRPWSLDAPRFDRIAHDLEAEGFEEIGAMKTSSILWSQSLRILVARDRGTFASIWRFMGRPRVSFVTALDGGRAAYTGGIDMKVQRSGPVVEQGLAGDWRPRLAAHEALVDREGIRQPMAAATREALLAERVRLAEGFDAAVYRGATRL